MNQAVSALDDAVSYYNSTRRDDARAELAELRAEVERLRCNCHQTQDDAVRDRTCPVHGGWIARFAEIERERDTARAEVERLREWLPRCFCCARNEAEIGDALRVAPVVTGDRFNEQPKYPICPDCLREWYEGGHKSWEEVRLAVKSKEAKL